ncbi:MAG: tetratricopeptide repeat protein [Chloroflexi bacterium]|nr:tetratricopeptide repeat protein [Chloroflexota bacterium]MCL5075667.1 tetratricopeptide repeat protein [Chloroflexota bacterium]
MTKKSKRRKERRKKSATGHPRVPPVRSREEIDRLRDLWSQGKEAQALEGGKRLLKTSPKDPQIHVALGEFYAKFGQQTKAFKHLETAAQLLPLSPEVALLQATIYEEMGLHAHALRAARCYLSLRPSGEEAEQVRQVLWFIEPLIAKWATRFDVSVKRMKQGSLLMEEGRLAIASNDFAYGLRSSQAASRLLPKWAVPRNNVALAQFYLGKTKEAITTEEEVLTDLDPDNIHALANLIHFHVVLGQMEQAQAYGDRLKILTPAFFDDHLKMAEAFASLKRDQAVYNVLSEAKPTDAGAEIEREWLLGVAAANLRKIGQAQSHLARADVGSDVFRSKVAGLIRHGLPGPGRRYPYYSATRYLPQHISQRGISQLGDHEKGSEQSLRDLAKRHPALIDIAAECLWLLDDEAAKSAINDLRDIGDAKAIDILRCFATGRVGSDEARMYAALALFTLEADPSGEPITIIKDGRPTPMRLHRFTIITSKAPSYTPEIERILEQAIIAQREGHKDRAEHLYKEILANNPNVKEALGNLGVLYLSQGDRQRGEEYLRKALKIDPLYVTARTNLASIRLSEDRMKEAKDLLQPLSEVTEFHVEEMIRYLGVMARLALAEEHVDEAKGYLKIMLELDPDNEWARNAFTKAGLADRFLQARRRYKERKQKQQISPNEPLLSLLSRYSKDALTGIAREIFLRAISGLKKDTLISTIRDLLRDADALEKVLQTLNDEDQAALGFVLQAGGVVPLAEFAKRYGDDADESPYWNWHVPKTSLGRLKVRGLLFEGTYKGHVVLVMPDELRLVCQTLMNSA